MRNAYHGDLSYLLSLSRMCVMGPCLMVVHHLGLSSWVSLYCHCTDQTGHLSRSWPGLGSPRLSRGKLLLHYFLLPHLAASSPTSTTTITVLHPVDRQPMLCQRCPVLVLPCAPRRAVRAPHVLSLQGCHNCQESQQQTRLSINYNHHHDACQT